jgi:adenine-specific DNA-methyltransferase
MDADAFSSSHDFILAYAKNTEEMIFQKIEKDEDEAPSHYNQVDEDGRSYYLKPLRAMGGQGETREARPNLYYALKSPDGSDIFPRLQNGSDGAWRWSKEKVEKEAARIEWRQGRSDWSPYFRIYADMSAGRPPETIWYHRDVGSSRTAKAQIKKIFAEVAFDTPKPLGLLERVIEIASLPNSIVLDSFAGSGTTAHAVIEANKRDRGTRKFILVESESYADTLTAERMRRVINGYSFSGTQKTELLKENLNWRAIENADRLRDNVKAIENLHGHEYDRITKQVKDGQLVVTGEKTVAEKAEGLGGSFTYCTLGPAIALDKILSGETLPAFAALGSALFHMATNRAFDPAQMVEADFYLGETGGQHIWLIYKPDIEWLKSPDAALTLSRAKAFVAAKANKARHMVFAPSRYVSTKLLAEQYLPVEFVPLPFALYRIERA